MAMYPNNRRDIFGFQPTRTTGSIVYRQQTPATQVRLGYFVNDAIEPTSSIPGGLAPFALFLPLTAGGMVARSYASMTATANALNGGPMQADANMAMTMDAPSMSLIVSMTAPWTGAYTPTAALRLTIGMEAAFTATFTGTSNLAMIVPLGSTTFAAAFTGSADLKGNLSMTAEFGGAEPLSPEGLANAVWAKAIEAGFTAAEILRLIAAVQAGDATGLDGNASFTGIDGSTTRVAGTRSGGNRTITTRDGA
jgi:hypothetical protein